MPLSFKSRRLKCWKKLTMRNNKGEKSPKSNAQRQSEFKSRKLEKGLAEVRGIYANEDGARKIKEFAKNLNSNTTQGD